MTRHNIFIASSALGILSLFAAAYTIWNTWWLGSSVVAMAEDMERDGIIDAARAAELRTSSTNAYTSTGAYLMQRHDRSVANGLYLLSAVSTGGFGILALLARSQTLTPPPTSTQSGTRC